MFPAKNSNLHQLQQLARQQLPDDNKLSFLQLPAAIWQLSSRSSVATLSTTSNLAILSNIFFPVWYRCLSGQQMFKYVTIISNAWSFQMEGQRFCGVEDGDRGEVIFSSFQILFTLMFSCSLCRLCRSRFRSCRMQCTLKTRRREWLSSGRSWISSGSLGRTLQR